MCKNDCKGVQRMKKEKKAGENMSEREKEIMEEIKMALPYMSDFDKGYMLCLAEKSKEKELVQQ